MPGIGQKSIAKAHRNCVKVHKSVLITVTNVADMTAVKQLLQDFGLTFTWISAVKVDGEIRDMNNNRKYFYGPTGDDCTFFMLSNKGDITCQTAEAESSYLCVHPSGRNYRF